MEESKSTEYRLVWQNEDADGNAIRPVPYIRISQNGNIVSLNARSVAAMLGMFLSVQYETSSD